ncbi:MAG: PAS domain S-box protein, partial [Bacteroidales bacterium]|nr:PAS domain S-box protein [Bacteroidales bacterium]
MNQSFCNMFGWKEEDLLHREPPYPYWHENDSEKIRKAFEDTLANRAPAHGFDLHFRHKSGKTIPVNVIVSPLRQDDDKVFYLANVIDITERKRTEEELIKSRILLLSSIESQKNTIIFFLDRKYNYLYFNQAHRLAMKYAYNVDIEEGMNMVECMSIPVDQQRARENFDRALKGESFTYLNTFGTVNRDYYEVLLNPIPDEKGTIIGCTGFARNISDRIKAENELRNSETKFREIINQINDAIIVYDEKKQIIIWNKGAENIFGLNPEDAIGRSISDLLDRFPPKFGTELPSIDKVIDEIVSRKKPELFNIIVDSEIITPFSETPRNIQSTVFPIKLDDSHLFCTVIRDTTEIRRYEREMLRVSAEKDKFYSTLAQYLQTPFNLFSSFYWSFFGSFFLYRLL